MSEQELLIKISKVKKERFLSRVAIIVALIVAAILYYMGIHIIHIGVGYIILCVLIMLFVGLPTQKKLSEYQKELKKMEEE